MNNEHVPRLSKALFVSGLGFVVLIFSWKLNDIGMFWSAFVAGVFFVLLGLSECYFLIAESLRQDIMAKESIIKALANSDGEVRNAVGVWWPEFCFEFTDVPVITWQGTDVSLETFRRFMLDSNEQYISPERNWAPGLERREWEKIRNKLQELGLVIPDSAAGPRSWLWRINGYKHAYNRWMRYQVKVVEALKEFEK
jgi:hypothetical protein